MSDAALRTLTGHGLDPGQASLLAGRLAAGDAEEGQAGVLLRAGVEAAADPRLLVRALPILLDALEQYISTLDPHQRAVLWHLRGLKEWRVAQDIPAATRALNRSVTLLEANEGERASEYVGRVFDTLGQMLHHQGLLSAARRDFERALALKQACGDQTGAALTEGNLGRLCMELGDFAAAADHLRRDLDYVVETDPENVRLRGQLLTQIGACCSEIGVEEDAKRALNESLALAQASGDATGQAYATAHLGRLALYGNDPQEALARAETARALLEDVPAFVRREIEGLVMWLLADVEQRRGDTDRALVHFAEAAEHFHAAGRISPVENAEFLQTYALACEGGGRAKEAVRLLREALHLLDATTAEDLRNRIDAQLRTLDESTWMVHSTGRFVGHGQIDLLLSEAGQSGFRGREEEVTVLFSDLRGFTSFAEGLEAEVLIEILNRYLAHMTRCVEHFGGMVDKFIGDAVMAVFCLPQPHDDDADRATDAALYMEAELERFNRSLPAGLPPLKAGIGLHRGPVVAGLIGSPQKRSYTVIGDAVNTASRLEGMTKLLGVPVLVSGEVVERLAHAETRLMLPLGRFRPKGRQGAIDVFQPLGTRDGGSRSCEIEARIAAARGALACFLGRDFDAAARRFEDLRAGAAEDEGAHGFALLSSAAAVFAATPPADDWDGSIEMTEK